MADKITLREAMETPAWMMVYAAEPGRNIDVTMTYADLFEIHGLIQLRRMFGIETRPLKKQSSPAEAKQMNIE